MIELKVVSHYHDRKGLQLTVFSDCIFRCSMSELRSYWASSAQETRHSGRSNELSEEHPS